MFINRIASVSRNGVLMKRYFSLSPFLRMNNYKPSNVEKRYLVWTGKYKSIAEVPNMVSNEEMNRCKNVVRVRVATILMGLTILGCVLMVVSGKSALKRGETVSKQNIDWHKRYNESVENQDKR